MWTKDLVIPPQEIQANPAHDAFDSSITGMRVHELAIVRWLNTRFFVRTGYPIPVVLTKPMLAYDDFVAIWQQPGNVFSYLEDAKDERGTPIYRPWPEAPKYPLITVDRKVWAFDSHRNFGHHWFRHASWVTVSKDVEKRDLARVIQTQMPQAYTYTFQIDHYATRVDGQAYFIEQLQNCWFGSAAEPYTYIKVVHPGVCSLMCRVRQAGDITDSTEDSQPTSGGTRIYRTTVPIAIEGFKYSHDYTQVPVFWRSISRAVNPADLEQAYVTESVDIRDLGKNGVFDSAIGNELP